MSPWGNLADGPEMTEEEEEEEEEEEGGFFFAKVCVGWRKGRGGGEDEKRKDVKIFPPDRM